MPALPVDAVDMYESPSACGATYMTTILSCKEAGREQSDLSARPASVSERTDTAASVDNMRSVVAARIEMLPESMIRAMFHILQGPRLIHAVDFRVSIRLPFVKRFYVNFAAGPEQRNQIRLSDEGLNRSSRLAVFYGAVIVALLGYFFFGLFCFLYLLKSVLNINIFSGASPLHPLYELFVA